MDLTGALLLGTRGDDVDYVEFLLSFTKDTKQAQLVLSRAAKDGSKVVMKLALDAGVDPNFDDGRPLMAAADQGFSDCISLLVAHGADPNANGGQVLLFGLMIEKKKIAIEKLLDLGVQPTVEAISKACKMDNLEDARLLLDRMHLDLDSALLAVCSSQDRTDLVAEFISRGANVLHDDCEALAVASAAGSTKSMKLLLDAGCDAGAGNSKALIRAVYSYSENMASVVSLLLEHGADPTVEDGRALREAADRPNCHPMFADSVQILLAAQKDLGRPIPGLQEALCGAARSFNPDAVDFIILAGADPAYHDGAAFREAAVRQDKMTFDLLVELSKTPLPAANASIADLLFSDHIRVDQTRYQMLVATRSWQDVSTLLESWTMTQAS
ncbi:hypothetical protein HKX48_001653 [Thoreauomyces humboldtii]|nr:hypothetical protein HKX48_001653 [Thoreauomyces humboldtii]